MFVKTHGVDKRVTLMSAVDLSWYWYINIAAAAAKSFQSCPTLWGPIDGSPPGSPIPGSLQARTLEWVAISFSSAWKWKVNMKLLSHVRLFENPWIAAYQASPSTKFSGQEYWSGVPLPSPISTLDYYKNVPYKRLIIGETMHVGGMREHRNSL